VEYASTRRFARGGCTPCAARTPRSRPAQDGAGSGSGDSGRRSRRFLLQIPAIPPSPQAQGPGDATCEELYLLYPVETGKTCFSSCHRADRITCVKLSSAHVADRRRKKEWPGKSTDLWKEWNSNVPRFLPFPASFE
jgi:hypothetical protein